MPFSSMTIRGRLGGADPRRLLLLTFTRRAALEMTRRAQQILVASQRGRAAGGPEAALLPWSGTFHSIGNRLLRRHAATLSLDPAFTVLDRADSADLMDLVRSDLGLARTRSRFPKKGTCLAIYSYSVNAGCPLEETLVESFPWCDAWEAELKRLFAAYVAAKQRDNVLDYDDLLLYWHEAVQMPGIAAQMRADFDHILVDEYQDTNRLQAAILLALAPDGAGLTVVGDDAQSIYAFRAATVRNILDFPDQFSPRAAVISLEHNYRSVQPILDAANAVIAQAREGFSKTLTSSKLSAELPHLVTVEDEMAQAVYVADQVLEHREAGIDLRHQAVLFRTSHHSGRLEIEPAGRNIPFVKYGGLKFFEAAHVKDLLAILRWAENPRDALAGFRVLQLLPGIGPASAKKAMTHLGEHRFDLGELAGFAPADAAALSWPGFCRMLRRLCDAATAWAGQVGLVAFGERDPRLLAARPNVPGRPEPRCIVERTRPDTDHPIARRAGDPRAAFRANPSDARSAATLKLSGNANRWRLRASASAKSRRRCASRNQSDQQERRGSIRRRRICGRVSRKRSHQRHPEHWWVYGRSCCHSIATTKGLRDHSRAAGPGRAGRA